MDEEEERIAAPAIVPKRRPSISVWKVGAGLAFQVSRCQL